MKLAQELSQYDNTLRVFGIPDYGRFQEVCKKQHVFPNGKILRVSYTINISEKPKEQMFDTIWVVKLGFDFRSKEYGLFKLEDTTLQYVARFNVNNWTVKEETPLHLLVSG